MKNIVLEHIHRNGITFRLSLMYNDYDKTYNRLVLEYLGKHSYTYEINVYFLDMYARKGQLIGWANLNERIDKDIKTWIKRNK